MNLLRALETKVLSVNTHTSCIFFCSTCDVSVDPVNNAGFNVSRFVNVCIIIFILGVIVDSISIDFIID